MGSNHQAEQMVDLLAKLAPHEGYTRSQLDSVRFMRANGPIGRTPVLYEPGIVIVCQGSKRGYLADKVYRYDSQHYLVLSVPLPFSTETDATAQEPLLALSVGLDMTVLTELIVMLDEEGYRAASPPQGIISTPLDSALSDVTLRLLRALASPLEGRILGPSIIRELYYRMLIGEQGGAIRAALASQGHFARISRVLAHIHRCYYQPVSVGELAKRAGLSIPAFHAHFRAITNTSPVQYIKSVRLQQARLLMIRDNLTAASAGQRVGYESPSQFNREFRRLFGRPPGEEARVMRHAFSLLPSVQLAAVVATH